MAQDPRFRPTCSRCGGASFRPKRSTAGKLVGGVAAPKSRVQCLGCGAEYPAGRVPMAPVPVDPTAGHTHPAGWYPDPLGRHELRWWGGISWTEGVRDGIIERTDPLPNDVDLFVESFFESFTATFTAEPAPAAPTVAEQIRELAALRDEGLLTEEEFQAQKSRLLG